MTVLGSKIQGFRDVFSRLPASTAVDERPTATEDPCGVRQPMAGMSIPGSTDCLRYNQEFSKLAALPRRVLPQLEAMTQ